MKLSALGSYLSQTEAALLYVIAEKVMRDAENVQTEVHPAFEDPKAQADAEEAHAAAYVLKTVAEQSIMNNDGMVLQNIRAIKSNPAIQSLVELVD